LVPHHRRLALVGDTDRGYVGGVTDRPDQCFGGDAALRGQDVARIVLHPAGLRVDLLEFTLCGADDFSGMVEDQRARAGGALIECENIFHGSSSQGFVEKLPCLPIRRC
jgi:hypothetical protein